MTALITAMQAVTGPLRRSLSAQLLAFTIIFVLIAEIIVLIPSVAKFRLDWMSARLEAGYLVSVTLKEAGEDMIEQTTRGRLFSTARIVAVNVEDDSGSALVYAPTFNAAIVRPMLHIDLEERGMIGALTDAWATLFSRGRALLHVTGWPTYAGGKAVELIVEQDALRTDLLRYTLNILALSLVISTLTAALFYRAATRVIVRPVARLTSNMDAFNQTPEDAGAVIAESAREDEIGEAERGLRALELRVQELLSQRRRLAALGAGISKVTHDLRNILASAQLMSDRLARSDDPRVRSLAPRLIRSLDRAIALSRDTLHYGRMEPSNLKKSSFSLHELVDEIFTDAASLQVDFVNEVDDAASVVADRNQLYRAMFNLVRNAVDAIAPDAGAHDSATPEAPPAVKGAVIVRARREHAATIIDIEDDGPGLSDVARENLFEPFKGSQKPGGSGLGVAISHEILRAHGGALALLRSDASGTAFRLTVPATH